MSVGLVGHPLAVKAGVKHQSVTVDESVIVLDGLDPEMRLAVLVAESECLARAIVAIIKVIVEFDILDDTGCLEIIFGRGLAVVEYVLAV